MLPVKMSRVYTNRIGFRVLTSLKIKFKFSTRQFNVLFYVT